MSGTAAKPSKEELRAKDVLTTTETAILCDSTRTAVQAWLTEGVTISTREGRRRVALRGRKVGGHWRIARADLERFIEATTNAALSPDALGVGGETPAAQRKRADEEERAARELLGD